MKTTFALPVLLQFAFVFASVGSTHACGVDNICDSLWVAAHDVGVPKGFFQRKDIQVAAEDIVQGDILVANRNINVRSSVPRAGWGKPAATLMRGEKIIVLARRNISAGTTRTQVWLQIQPSPTFVAAIAPIATSRSALPPSSSGQPVSAPSDSANIPNGIWWEHPVGEATGGYDAKENQTLINSFDLVVRGPSSVEAAIRDVVETCVQASAVAAYEAFKASPSPEVGARIGAAWASFHATLPPCFKIKSVSDELAKKFEVGYIRRGRWTRGLNLKFVSENPITEQYRSLHNLVKDKLPDPVNKLISFYIAAQDIPPIDIKLDPPQALRDVLAQLPDPKELREFAGYAEKYAIDDGKKLLTEIKDEAQKVVGRLGGDALKNPGKIIEAPVRLAEEVANKVKEVAPKFVDALVPQVKDGKIIYGPIVIETETSPSGSKASSGDVCVRYVLGQIFPC